MTTSEHVFTVTVFMPPSSPKTQIEISVTIFFLYVINLIILNVLIRCAASDFFIIQSCRYVFTQVILVIFLIFHFPNEERWS